MREKIRTLHPEGKQGRSIDKGKYEAMCEAILTCLGGGALTHAELNACVEQKVRGTFQGSVGGYVETVKLDLEARKRIRRVQDAKRTTYCVEKS